MVKTILWLFVFGSVAALIGQVPSLQGFKILAVLMFFCCGVFVLYLALFLLEQIWFGPSPEIMRQLEKDRRQGKIPFLHNKNRPRAVFSNR